MNLTGVRFLKDFLTVRKDTIENEQSSSSYLFYG